MRGENGFREWLVGWAGEDAAGNGWDDSWEPTSHVSPDLREAFLSSQKARTKRQITIDPAPLDAMVPTSLALSVQHGAKESFGLAFETPIHALTHADLAEYVLSSAEERFGITRIVQYVPKSKETITEVRITAPEQIGTFCAFEKYIKSGAGLKSLVFRGSRRTATDMLIVGYVVLRTRDNKRGEGVLRFEVEHQTCYINGDTGNIVGPHLADPSEHLMLTENIEKVIAYARTIIPPVHPLVGAGWTSLPPNVYTVPTPVSMLGNAS